MRITKYLFTVVLFLATSVTRGQDNTLLNELMAEQPADSALLPARMLLTQRMLWGEKGVMRTTGISRLNVENRQKEMQTRRFLLKTHQALGFVTLAGMVAQGILGSQLYKGDFKVKEAHEMLATGLNVTYSLGAITSLLAPPPLVNRDKKITSLRLHKWLAIAHMSGMIATNILADKAGENAKYKSAHRATAMATFASFAAAMVVIKF